MQAEVFFENIQAEIKLRLSQAQKSVKIAVAYFTDNEIFDLLCSLAENDIKVELIISDEYTNFKSNNLYFHKLTELGGEFYISINEDKIILHNKFCIVDENVVMTGSYNWSYRAQKNMENIIVISENDVFTNKFLQEFDKIKSLSTNILTNRKSFLLESGIKSFDDKFGGFYSSSVVILASESQIGKTSFLLSIINNVTQTEENKVMFLSLADSEETIADQFLSISSGVDLSKIKNGQLSEVDLKRTYINVEDSKKRKLKISELVYPQISEIREKIISLRYQSDIRLFIIDNIEKFSSNSLSVDTKQLKHLETIVVEIKKLARELNIAIICSLSILKDQRRGDNQITLDNLGVLGNHATTIYTLYKEEYYDITLDTFRNNQRKIYLKALKNNNNGILGTISLRQDNLTRKFDEFEEELMATENNNSAKLYINKASRWNDGEFDEDAPF